MENHSVGEEQVQRYESHPSQLEGVPSEGVAMVNECEQDTASPEKRLCVNDLGLLASINQTVQGSGKKGKTSWVWQHLTLRGNGQCSCNVCEEILGTRSTTTLQYHLTHVHKMQKPPTAPNTSSQQRPQNSIPKKTRKRRNKQPKVGNSAHNMTGDFSEELSEFWQLTSPVKMENPSVGEEEVQEYQSYALQLEDVLDVEVAVEGENEQDRAGPSKKLRVDEFSQSPTNNQAVQGSGRKPKTSWVWQHLTLNGNGQCSCNICKEILGAKSTTTLQYHLIHVHKIPKPPTTPNTPSLRSSALPSHKAKVQSKMEKGGNQRKMSHFQTKAISKKIAEWIAADMLPPHVVHGRGFKKLISYIAPGYQIPHRTTFTRTHIPAVMKTVMANVHHDLRCALHGCYTTDIWSDNYLHNSYMTITVHFITPSWEMRSYVLTTVMLNGSINNRQILEVLKTTQKDWDLNQITHSVVTDQGSNVFVNGRIAGWHHMHCFGHKLNLCLTKYGVDIVPELSALLEKCKDIVKFFRYKGPDVVAKQEQLQPFMETLVENDHTYSNITFDIATASTKRAQKTRWISICTMIEFVIMNHEVIHSLLMQYEKMELTLRSNEIRGLTKLMEFLVPFKRQSEAMQVDRWPTLSRVWPAVCSLMKRCESTDWDEGAVCSGEEEFSAFGVDYRAAIANLKAGVLAALKIKFPKDETLILASSLDLRFKNLADAYKTIEQYEKGIKHFLAEIKDDPCNYTSSEEVQDPSNSTSTEFYEIYGAVMDEQDSAAESNLVSELRTYLALPRLSKIEIGQFNLLLWWRDHEKTFPLLSCIAKKVHSIVATSASSERIFSKAGNVFSEKRSRLSPSNVNTFVFLHTNMYNDEELAIPE